MRVLVPVVPIRHLSPSPGKHADTGGTGHESALEVLNGSKLMPAKATQSANNEATPGLSGATRHGSFHVSNSRFPCLRGKVGRGAGR